MSAYRTTSRTLRCAVTFLLLAPAVGAFLYWVGNLFALALPATLERGWDSRAFAASVKLLVNFYLLSGYMVGALPALVAGVAHALLNDPSSPLWRRLVIASAFAASAQFLFLAVTGMLATGGAEFVALLLALASASAGVLVLSGAAWRRIRAKPALSG